MSQNLQKFVFFNEHVLILKSFRETSIRDKNINIQISCGQIQNMLFAII